MAQNNRPEPNAGKPAELEDIIKRLEKENGKLLHDLTERKKELNAIYKIENIVEVHRSLEDILRAIVGIIPPAYQYPEVTCARITIWDTKYRTENFKETAWKQDSVIAISGIPAGSVEVYYTENMPESDEGPFLTDERKLIDELAKRIGKIATRIVAQRELQKSEDRFKKLVETTNDLIWEVDDKGVYTYVSPRIKELLGYEPEEVIGKLPFDLMPQDEGISIATVFYAIASEQKKFSNLENINLHKDGHRVILETSAVPFFDPDGTFRGYRGIDRDITKRKQTEEDLKKTNIALQDSLNSVKLLSGLLPICASCKRIRTEKGYWEGIEKYIAKHSEAEFSHSICEECAKRLYPEETKKKE